MTFNSDKNDRPNSGEPEKQGANDIAIWIPIGVGFGIPLGLVFHNLALGIALGASLGIAIGAAMARGHRVSTVEDGSNQAKQLLLLAGLGVLLLLVATATFAFLALR